MTQTQWDTQLDQERFERTAHELLILKANKAVLEKEETALKKTVMGDIEKYGTPSGSQGQHLAIKFTEPIRGFIGLLRQSKTSVSVDETRAEAIARQKGIYDRLFKMRPVLDQDAVMVAVAEGIISDAELEEIFPQRTTYALVPEKAK